MPELTARALKRLQRQMREDFYRRRGEKPPAHLPRPVEVVDTSPTASVAKPVRRPPPPRPAGLPPAHTARGQMLAWLVANGAGTAPQIASALNADPGTVNVGLLKLSKRGYTERTGRKIPSPNSRPHTEWRATGKGL